MMKCHCGREMFAYDSEQLTCKDGHRAFYRHATEPIQAPPSAFIVEPAAPKFSFPTTSVLIVLLVADVLSRLL